jgi:hypothetical protein
MKTSTLRATIVIVLVGMSLLTLSAGADVVGEKNPAPVASTAGSR